MNPLLLCLTLLLSQQSTHLLVEAKEDGFIVEMFHRDSIMSPFYDPNATSEELVVRAAFDSGVRANRLAASLNMIKMVAPIIEKDFLNLMKLSFGSPPVESIGLIDSGSDLMWVQCQPCKHCFPQTSPIFNPANSPTYSNLPCSSKLCKTSTEYGCGPRGECVYKVTYVSEESSAGVVGKDTMTLYSTDGKAFPFPNTVFGCGNDNSEDTTGGFNVGFFGFSFGEKSFVRQLGDKIQNRFSVCLLGYSANKPSKIKFGADAVLSGPGVVTTPLVFRSGLPLYLMDFAGITVGNEYVENKVPRTGPGNIILDTGATQTYLIDSFYNDVEAAVKRAVPLRPVQPAENFHLCYDAFAFRRLPLLEFVFHFDNGAYLTLKKENTFFDVGRRICLAMAPNPLLNIYGATAHVNFQVSYDLGKKTVSFAPADCVNI